MPLVWYGIAFALLGLSVGLFSGLSHSPVIGVLLPLLFGLIGGAGGLYLSRVDLNDPKHRSRVGIIGRMLTVFLIFVISGALYGMVVRTGSGITALVPGSARTEPVTTSSVDISGLRELNTAAALELSLLRFRLQGLGVGTQEQKVILEKARRAIAPHADRDQAANAFGTLFALAEQVYTLLDEQRKRDAPYEVERIWRFINITLERYGWLIEQLPKHNVPIGDLVGLIEQDRNNFSELIREQSWRREEQGLTEWLLSTPEVRRKLWEMELAYNELYFKMKDLGWLSGQPLAESIDRLIQSGVESPSETKENLVSQARRRTGFAP